MIRLLCWLLLVLSFPTYAINQQDLLPPTQAFKVKVEAISPDKLKATWDIADGYYLYRKRFAFETSTDTIKLKEAAYPKGDTKNDPSFGPTEVFHKQVVVEVPLERGQTATQAAELALKVKYQGCADAGLCFPPQTYNTTLQLAANASSDTGTNTTENKPLESNTNSSSSTAVTAKQSLLENLKSANKEETAKQGLPVDQAFQFELKATNKNLLTAHWTIQPDHHLYRPKIHFTVIDPQGVKLGTPDFPKGEMVDDEFFGKIEVYGSDIDVKVPILASNLPKLKVETEYQGCSDKTGLCYAPVTKVTELTLEGLPKAQQLPKSEDSAENIAEPIDERDAIVNGMRDNSYLQTLILFFVSGLGLAFTPCVFPMIPILSGIIAGYGNLSSRKGFWLSVAYVLPMAITYAIVGIIAGLSGANLQLFFQNPWVIGSFAGLFVLLALSMFGFYDLQMPVSIQSRLSEISNRQQGGSFIGAGIMGVLSALIVGPCVTAPLIGAFVYIAQTRDALLGGLALFALGLGMGVPLLMIGTSAGKLLPRAGAWMDTTKAIFGIMMLGLAIWMLNRIVPLEITMALTGTLLTVSGIYMGALEKINEEAGGWGRFWKSIGLILLFYGAMTLFGVAAGSKSLLQPLKGIWGGGQAVAEMQKLKFQRVKGIDGVEQALAAAKTNNKPVMLDFYADWCVSCKELEETTFKDSNVINALGETVLLQADLTANDDKDKALMTHYNIYGPPQIVFFNTEGKEITALRLAGYEAAIPFMERLDSFKQAATP